VAELVRIPAQMSPFSLSNILRLWRQVKVPP